MNERAPDTLRPLLQREYAALRRAVVVRHALRALAAAAAWIALLLLAGAARASGPAAATVRGGLLAAGLVAVLVRALLAVRRDVPRFGTWLESLELRFPELRSWLRNALDLEATPDPRTSPQLAAALHADAARRLGATPLAAERAPIRPRGPVLATVAAAAAVALLAMLAPRAAQRSWLTLWNPALAAPPVLLAVEPGSVTLAPGATLAVRARVRGSAAAPRLLGDGPAPAPQLEANEAGERRWRFDLPPVTRAREYAVRVVSTRSPRYRISLAGEPQPVSFRIEYRAPAYARLPAQEGTSTSGDLAALRGSVAAVEVTFDRDVEDLAVGLPGGASGRFMARTPRRWHGEVPVREDGEWTLRAAGANGTGASRYRIQALADAAPVITVAAPEADLDLPSGSQVPYDVLVQDDLGLADLRLEYRKEASQPWRDVPLSSFRGQPREARIASAWDAGSLALLPGEVGTFRFVVRDNARPGANAATSQEFRLRFPSMAELYKSLDERQEGVQQSLQQVADHARELQKQLDRLQRQQPRPGTATPPQYERSEEMRQALERQKELARQIDQAAEATRQSMADAAERQAFREELQQKLREMSNLMRQIQSPDFHEALKRMQDALEKMDRSKMEQELLNLREQNQDLLKSLERSLALLKQMRDEERMDALAKRAEEQATKQDQMNKEHAALAKQDGKDKAAQQKRQDLAQREREAAQQAQQLAKDAQEGAQQTESPDAKQDLQDAAQQLQQQAAPQQQQAADQSENNQSQQAQQSGGQASQDLREASQKMNRSSASAQSQRQARQLAAVRRSTQDLVSLGREASQNMQGESGQDPNGQNSRPNSSNSDQQQADRQTDLSEGVGRVADSLAALGRETPVLSPQVQEALGRAMQGLQQSGRELSQGNRGRASEASRRAGTALGDAVKALRSSEASMCNKPGNKPGKGQGQGDGQPQPSPSQRMGQMGEQQAQVNERSKQLSQRMGQAQRLSPGDQAEMRRLADEQARLRSELEDIQKDDAQKRQLLGRLDQAQHEMQQAEEMLRQGHVGDELEEHQTHILSRLLDAQRSINRRDYDPEREAHTGVDVARPSPAPLPTAMLRESDRLRLGLMKADADRYPAQYRALIERYLQRLNGSTR